MARGGVVFLSWAVLFLAPGVSPTVSPLQAQVSIRQQWDHSPHARSMDTADERERMNQPGCARCHSAQGYHHETLGGAPSEAPYPDVEGLTCTACHEAGASVEGIGALRAGAARDACRGCHDEVVASRPDYLSWCSQWGIFEGTGGMAVAESAPGESAHSALEKGCVSCHMAVAGDGLDPTAVGGHTFTVKSKGTSPAVFNPGPCEGCHAGMSLDWLEASQETVQALLTELAGLLPQKPSPEDPDVTEPRYPADPSLTEAQARASHNYWLVQKDGSFGVHNPVYSRALLESSIKELESGVPAGQAGAGISSVGQGRIDHVIWAVPDRAEGAELFEEMSGVEPVIGGVHPGRGTRNSLVSAGEGTYLEIIAPDPEQMPFDPASAPVQAFAKEISEMEGPEVDMFAFSVPDLETVAERARELGLKVVGPSPGQRMTPEGVLIRWSHADFIEHGFGQFLPFAIDWLDSPHPSTNAPRGAELMGITVEHPRAEELGRIYRGLGVPATVVKADEPRIIVRMRSDKGEFDLTSGKSLLAYYAARNSKNIKQN